MENEMKETQNPYSTFSYIFFYFDDKLIVNHRLKPESKNKFTISDWMWVWCHYFSVIIPKLMDNQEHVIESLDDPEGLILTKKMEKINVKLKSGDYKRNKYRLWGEITLPFGEFLEEILELIERFAKEMISINPKVAENPEFKQIIQGREKIRKMISEIK